MHGVWFCDENLLELDVMFGLKRWGLGIVHVLSYIQLTLISRTVNLT
jgi:hypothetical protein